MAKNNITDLYKNLTSQDSSNNSNVGKLVGSYLGDYTKSKDADKDAQENLIAMILGQEFAERSAEKQNQYNIEAEQREREWNSLGAQAERARSAGISPIAALGMSSGSSIGTQVASASGSGTNSSTRSRQSDIAALNSAIDQVNTQIRERQLALEEQRVENETSVAEAEVAKKESETIAQQFENQIRPMLNELKLDDIETQKIKNSVERAVNSGGKDSLAYKQAMQELENLVKDTSVKEEIKNLTIAQIDTERSRKTELDTSSQLNEARIRQVTAEAGLTEAEAYHLAQFYSTPDAPPWTALSGLFKRFVDDGQKGIKKFIDYLKSGSKAEKKLGAFIDNLPDKKQKRFIDAMVKASENYD